MRLWQSSTCKSIEGRSCKGGGEGENQEGREETEGEMDVGKGWEFQKRKKIISIIT